MPSLASVQLLTATLDLQLVKLLRGAMRTADESAGKTRTAQGLPTASSSIVHTQDQFLPRQTIHPSPRIEPRMVLHPQSKVEVLPAQLPMIIEPAHVTRLIPPVWKQMPWKCEAKPDVQIKIIVRKPDVHQRGTLIDLFM